MSSRPVLRPRRRYSVSAAPVVSSTSDCVTSAPAADTAKDNGRKRRSVSIEPSTPSFSLSKSKRSMVVAEAMPEECEPIASSSSAFVGDGDSPQSAASGKSETKVSSSTDVMRDNMTYRTANLDCSLLGDDHDHLDSGDEDENVHESTASSDDDGSEQDVCDDELDENAANQELDENDENVDYTEETEDSGDEYDEEEDEEEPEEVEVDENLSLADTEFRDLSAKLNEPCRYPSAPPPQLITRCKGLGEPSEVWRLLCRKDDLVRPGADVLDAHPAVKPHMRSVLIDWLMEVCDNERLHRETFHLAVDYCDRYLARVENIPLECFQLVGTTALFIATKYEEIYPPKLDEICGYTDGACEDYAVRKNETVMLKALDWSLTPVTSVHWLSLYLQLLGNKEEAPLKRGGQAAIDKPITVPACLREDFVHMAKVLDLCLLDHRTLRFSYRELAAAVVYHCFEPTSLVEQVTGYSQKSLARVLDWIKPVVNVVDKTRPAGDPLDVSDNIRPDDAHNIQHHFDGEVERIMADIESERLRLSANHKTRLMRAGSRPGPLRSRMSHVEA